MILASLLYDFSDQVEPPRPARDPLTFVRTLTVPTGEVGLKGLPYDPGLHPGQIIFWRTFATRKYQNYVIMADTQSGKSWTVQCVLFWVTCELKWDALYGLPDMRFCSDVWKKKLEPGIKGSGLSHHLPRSGSGSGGGTDVDTVYLHDAGSINFHGANAKNKAGGNDGRTIPLIINDELDSMPEEIANKNDRRADSFVRSAIRLKASTVKNDDHSNIVAAYENSTKTRYAPRCTKCRCWSLWEWEQFSYDKASDKTAEASARIACSICGHKMDESERQLALKDCKTVHFGQHIDGHGAVIGPEPESDTFGLCWWSAENPFKTLGQIAKWNRSAQIKADTGRSQDLIDFFHDQLHRPFPKAEGGEDMDAVRLAGRSQASTYPRDSIPPRAIFITAAVDQQKRSMVWGVKAHDMEGRTWRVGWYVETICGDREEPTPEQATAALDRVAAKILAGWPVQDSGRRMVPVITGIDVADWPARTRAWLDNRAGWMALHGSGAELAKKMHRGDGKDKRAEPGWYDVRTQEAHGGIWDLMWLDSDSIKHEVARSFALPLEASGSSMLPTGLGVEDKVIRELTAEEWKKNPETGKMAWMKIHRYNEAWDIDYYTQALGVYWRIQNPDYVATAASAGTRRRPDGIAEDFGSHLGGW